MRRFTSTDGETEIVGIFRTVIEGVEMSMSGSIRVKVSDSVEAKTKKITKTNTHYSKSKKFTITKNIGEGNPEKERAGGRDATRVPSSSKRRREAFVSTDDRGTRGIQM